MAGLLGHTIIIYASLDLQRSADVWVTVVQHDGLHLSHADEVIRANEQVVRAAVVANGSALQHASDELRANKEIVRAAVLQTKTALQFAKGGLNQDGDMLRAVGLWDLGEAMYSRKEKAIMSVKFSLSEKSSPYATEFALEMKGDPYLREFKTYNPNTFCKKSCDPAFTNFGHPCRGTSGTCELPPESNLEGGRPTNTSCWRFAFRYHQEECESTGGFMIQVEEKGRLGAGQLIEAEMADQVGLKIFKTFHLGDHFEQIHATKVSQAIKAWYDSNCLNKDVEMIML